MFDINLPPDDSPIENTNITTIQLFYSTEEHREFKELCKYGMIKMYPNSFNEANVNDFLLQVLRNFKAVTQL